MKMGLLDYWIVGLLVSLPIQWSAHQSINPSIHQSISG
jgi:hypothetical protein